MKSDLPHWFKEFLIALAVNIVVGVITYFLTLSLRITIITILITILGISISYYAHGIASVILKSGLRRVYADFPDPTPMLKQYFESSQNIRILAIRGARMLGSDRSLINYVIKELPKGWGGCIQILLLDPNSEYHKKRAEELDHTPAQFATECHTAIQNIYRLKKEYHTNIEVRLYRRKPILRTIIFDDHALLSYYTEEGHIPIQYELKRGRDSLLIMIEQIYDDLWDEAKPVIPQKGS